MLTTTSAARYSAIGWVYLFCALLWFGSAAAQPYWARTASSPGNEHIAAVQVDADGSIYITGEFGGTLHFGGQSIGGFGGLDAFVARLDPGGNLIWLKRAGGAGIDRGMKLSVGSGQGLAVAGEFMGTANLFGTSQTSAGGTIDAFVAVLNKSDGTLQWVKQAGGAGGTDSPGGVSMAPDGRVTVAGHFRGTATWDGQTLQSTMDPVTLQPSTDVFIATYSPTGGLLWLKHGAANKDDQAVDVVHDAAGNLYVTGQYSNTITFDQPYANTLTNASFLMRLAPDGSETWFRRLGGAVYNHVRGLAVAPSGELLVVGDQQGTMVWTGATTVNVPGAEPFNYYLLKVDAGGQLLGHTSIGSTSGVSAAALAVNGGQIGVLGTFDCQFSALAGHYGSDALFMATGAEDLFISVHALGDLALQEAQQFGGRSGKAAGGIAYSAQGELVFSGSFQQNLVFPAGFSFTGDAISYNVGGIGTTEVFGSWCSFPDYGSFAGCESNGLVDGFVARGYVQGRAPYDWWVRQEGACDRVQRMPCILADDGTSCGDTLVACGSATLNVGLHFAYHPNPDNRYVGPPLTFLWSTGSTNANITVTSSGTYWVNISTVNGCWHWTDTIEVVVHPLPPITWLSFGGAEPHPPPFGVIHLCDPEVTWLVASNLPDSGTWWWNLPNGAGQLYSDSTGVDTSGTYIFTVRNEFGCMRNTAITAIDHPTVPIPDIGMSMETFFPQDTNGTDTIRLCPQTPVQYGYSPTWTLNGVEVAQLPPDLNIRWCLAPCSSGSLVGAGPQTGYLFVNDSGWLVIDVAVSVDNLPCAQDTLWFHAIDSIYIELLPQINLSLALNGPGAICDGDSVLLTAVCAGCDTIAWWTSGAGVVQGSDQFLAWAPGQVTATGLATDANGCPASTSATIQLTAPTGPVLQVQPADGILCPGGSAVIHTTSVGTDAIWYGPQGEITGQGTTLATTTPGTYYLSLNVQGCPVTSNSVSITGYGTPYLAPGDLGTLCFPGDRLLVEVMATPGAVVQWNAPLSGSGLAQNIEQAGVYSCTVSACNIITPLEIVVEYAPAQVQLLTPGPFVLCRGDSVHLMASGSPGTYEWLPGMVPGAHLYAAGAGSYRVVLTNPQGCTDTSAVVQVNAFAFSDPLAATGDTVCAGLEAQLTATGSGTVAWYAAPGTGPVLGYGTEFQFIPQTSAMVYVRQQETGCTSEADSVWVEVRPAPSPVTIQGPDSLCVGDALQIGPVGPDTVQYRWATPPGHEFHGGVHIPEVALADMGYYVCTPVFQGCEGPSAVHHLTVHAPEPLGLPDVEELCEGGSVWIGLPPGFAQITWSNGSHAPAIELSGAGQISVQATDVHGCAVQGELGVELIECDLVVPNVFSPNGDGVNDRWFPTGGFTKALARIWNRWGNLVFEGDLVSSKWDGRHQGNGGMCSDGTYFYELELVRSNGAMKRVTGHLLLLGNRK